MHTQAPLVIKIGGGEGIDPRQLMPEVAALVRSGLPVVLIHGGSHETNVLCEQLGHPPEFLTSPSGHTSRRTDRATLEIFQMIYCGKINKGLVEACARAGINAVGLSGIDGGLWTGTRKDAIRAVQDGRTVLIRDDLSGTVARVDAGLLRLLLADGRTPILTPPAITEDGVAINVDADRAAAKTAVALGARTLLLLSNVPGVLRDVRDPQSLMTTVAHDALDTVRRAGTGRMKNKILAAEEAIQGGVSRVVIGSARGEGAIARALAGAGTVFIGAGA
jgi:[amino group carrier protein]-L-2-aminoadipate 6-kinase